MTAAQSEPKKRTLDVEAALQWAYRDELPKGYTRVRLGIRASSVSPMFRMCQFGVRIDNWSREPGFPLAMGSPHPNAEALDVAVRALTPADVDLTTFSAMYQIEGFGIDFAKTSASATNSLAALVTIRAKLADRPDLSGPPKPQPWRNANGVVAVRRIVEEDTEVASPAIRGGSYAPGSYCPLKWEPHAQQVLLERLEYAAWWAALAYLADTTTLDTINLRRPLAPRRPWLDGPPLAPRGLPDHIIAARAKRPPRRANVMRSIA